ncbi:MULTISPECIES: DUF1885 family protein [Bacillus]|uniref:DUF1885 family protein n=1 Tax=Bacillus TaxID=1386 RepID=UPI00031F9254|nr:MULTISPECIES: DUF1885 family protein [Bacillus]
MNVTESAYIKLVPSSTKQIITLDEIKDILHYYKEITSKTGTQLDWDYGDYAFPYEIKETEEGNSQWFYLSSTKDRYNIIIMAVGQELINEDNQERIQSYIQVSLVNSSTYGDKSKANEFCKFISKKLKGELHLFNEKIIYHYPRK